METLLQPNKSNCGTALPHKTPPLWSNDAQYKVLLNNKGMDFSCMGVGFSKPISFRTFNKFEESPKLSNVFKEC